MKHTDGTFVGVDGLRLFYQSWQSTAEPRAIVAIAHGVGEHGGRYMNVVNRLVPRGYVVFALDHRGHGRSPGRRGHINRWAEYREDFSAFLRRIRELSPSAPIFLLGHSMGALIGLDYLLHYPETLRGAIISGAPLEPGAVARPSLVAVARLLSRLWPTYSLRLGLDTNALSRDPEVVKAYNTDPLVHGRVTVRWGTECLAAIAWVKYHAADVKIPLFMVHGEADRLNLARGSRSFFDAVPFCDKTLRTYPHVLHEPHNDIDCECYLNELEQWIERHV